MQKQDDFKVLEEVVPDILTVLQERYRILQHIYWMQPVGRRNLSENLGLTERVLRTETDFLKNLNLISSSKSGMLLTKKGEQLYNQLGTLVDRLFGMRQLEKQLANYFGIEKCLIADGDSDQQRKVISSFGRFLNEALDAQLPEKENIIAVMGGTTMAMAAEELTSLETERRHNLFVPARGGIGESVNVQANSVSAVMAIKSHGDYRSLFVPEQANICQRPGGQRTDTPSNDGAWLIRAHDQADCRARHEHCKCNDISPLLHPFFASCLIPGLRSFGWV